MVERAASPARHWDGAFSPLIPDKSGLLAPPKTKSSSVTPSSGTDLLKE